MNKYKIAFYVLLFITILSLLYSLRNIVNPSASSKDNNDTTWTIQKGIDIDKDGKLDTTTIMVVKPKEDTKVDINALTGSFLLFLGTIYTAYKNKQKGPAVQEVDISKHPIFIKLEDLLMRDIQNIKIGGKGRTELFKVILLTQLETYIAGFKELVLDTQNYTTIQEVRNKCIKIILSIVSKYEHKWQEMQIPPTIIDRYKELHEDKIKIILRTIDTEIVTDFRVADYKNFIYSFLSSVSVILSTFITTDILSTLSSMNGELKKITFKGMTLE